LSPSLEKVKRKSRAAFTQDGKKSMEERVKMTPKGTTKTVIKK
jgi:hypothetical protein